MADKITVDTSKIDTKDIAHEVDAMQEMAMAERRRFSRKWYDNNFFDDGYHFRYVSRTTGRIVDLSDKDTMATPKRTIPKASRQIRGMANLVLSQDFVPIVKPERINKFNFIDEKSYMEAYNKSKKFAKRVGQWLQQEWDDQGLKEKLTQMALLTLKHGISFAQVWPDAVEERIRTNVYDAFEIFLSANHDSIYDSPFIGKATPKSIREIKSNEYFDKDQLMLISPDNKYASDEIKEAYLSSKYGKFQPSESAATLILKEFFIKETLGPVNISAIRSQENGKEILKDKSEGDTVIRQVFSAGGIWLRDEYVDLPEYPFVDLRWEPGAIYQTAPIERFISSNKGLDTIVARLETFLHTMNVGVWLKRKGEDFKISNVAGGLVAEYTSVPPTQMPLASPPPAIFNFIELLNGFIEEQGVSTSALGKIPSGVKAWRAIESLKESEYANLYTPLQQVKGTVKRISEKMLDIAANYFVSTQEVYSETDKGEPDYFDIIGERGLSARKKIKNPLPPETVPIKKDYDLDIEVQSGLAYTEEGKKGRMMELAEYMMSLSQSGIIDPNVTKEAVKKMLEIYQFGPTDEMLDALDQPTPIMDETMMQQMKVAVAETLKDVGYEPPISEEQRMAETKVSVAEVIKDMGLADKQEPEAEVKEPSQSISFKDLPPEGKAQLAAKAGIQLDPEKLAVQEIQNAKPSPNSQ